MAKPLVLDLHIPYCIRPENYLAHFNAVGSNAEKNAYMDALKRRLPFFVCQKSPRRADLWYTGRKQ